MRAFVLAVILAVVAGAQRTGPTWKQLDGYTFLQYCSDFGRNYEGAEYIRRQTIFDTKMAEIKAINTDPTKTWKAGVNQFTDWTDDEFRSKNTLKPNYQARSEAAYTHQMPAGATVPAVLDYRSWTSPTVLTGVKNQGACGGCWGFSAVESVESYFALLTGQLPVLSVQQILGCTQGGMAGCGGGDMSVGWKYLMHNSTGLNEQWLYPFVDFFAKNETMAATQKCQNITARFSRANFPWYPKAGVTGYARVAANDANATLHALATIGPQSISVAAASWNFYEGGIFQNMNILGNQTVWGIDHGVQLVGYGHDYDMDMDYWIVRNSWGTTWGEDGYIRLSRPKVEPCAPDPNGGPIVCGTSGVLSAPDHPVVTTLNKKNP